MIRRFGRTMAATAVVAAGLGAAACSAPRERAPALRDLDSERAEAADAGTEYFDVALDAALNCGSGTPGVCSCTEVVQASTPLYIVLDRSGSMNDKVAPATESKWTLTRRALFDTTRGVVRKLGSRVALGLALFPGRGVSADECASGTEVFSLTRGGTATSDALASILAAETPYGATPTASSLAALAPSLKKLPAPAYVLLATDGAPNCAKTACSIDRCLANIERASYAPGRVCDATINCCDESIFSSPGRRGCLDSEPTREAIADLAASGLKVFVLGMPGSNVYANELNQFAVAGGTARDVSPGEPKYYAASDSTQEALTAALGAIAAKILDSCVIRLAAPPSTPDATNVLFDGESLPQDPIDGWTFTDDRSVTLHGKACARVRDGAVSKIQVAVGCKTVVR